MSYLSLPGCVADSQVYPNVIQAGYLLGEAAANQ